MPVLHTLELRDFAIVDELVLELSPGLNVLTGETGAGKSIVVDALSLLAGGRAEAGMIRAEADSALVQGLFHDAGFEVAARRLHAGGRHVARIDGEVVTVAELAERAGACVAVFGQHAAAEMLAPPLQRRQLDRLLPPDAPLGTYRERFARYQQVGERASALVLEARERERRLDMLRFQLQEIDALHLRPGEDDALRREAETLGHAERIVQGAGHAFAALSDDDGGALERASGALRELRAAGRFESSLAALASDLEAAVAGMQAVASELEAFLAGFEADPGRLDAVHARLAKLEAVERKYGESVDAVLAFREEAAAELARLEHAENDLDELQRERARLDAELRALAADLGAARRSAAAELERRVLPSLADLGMAKARFSVEIEDAGAFGAWGADRVRFVLGANPGEPLAPLADVASGGELSRIMLALHVVTGSDVPVLAFDEVDVGIGGRTARSVGALLQRLSRGHQVLVVTHLPQVAAYADAHFAVVKEERGGRTVADVRRLTGDERVGELARMLSGSATETSLRHARELLQEAAPENPA